MGHADGPHSPCLCLFCLSSWFSSLSIYYLEHFSLFCCHCNIYHRIEHRFEMIYLSAQWLMFSANCCQLCVWNGYKADFSSSPALPFKLVLREIYQKVIPASSLFSFLFVCHSLITSSSASSCPLTCSFSLSSCSPISLSTPQVPAFYHYSLSFAHSYSPLLPSLLLYQHQTQGQYWRECCPGLDETNSIRRSCLFVFVALPYPYNSSVPSYFMSYLFNLFSLRFNALSCRERKKKISRANESLGAPQEFGAFPENK